jgi:hypothetical protein
MIGEPRNEIALASWEDEGGRVGSARRDSDNGRDGASHRLPPGYEAQPLWGFHDDTGRFSYQFHLVYGPPRRRDGRGAIASLDEQRSYWEVTWPTAVRTARQRLAGRSISYALARAMRHDLTFERFSSMRSQLPELFAAGDTSLEVVPRHRRRPMKERPSP